ncbi:MAG: PAS domain S-box protein [Balneolales bacterium]
MPPRNHKTKKAIEKEKLSEKGLNLKSILNSGFESVIIINATQSVVTFNDKAGDWFKILFTEPLREGIPINDFLQAKDKHIFDELFHDAISGKKVKSEDYLIDKQGEKQWFNFSFDPIIDDDNTINSICLSAEFIGERKRMEYHLEKSEKKFQDFIQNSIDLITVLKIDGQITFQSPTVKYALGYSPEELTNKNVISLIHPEDRAYIRSVLQSLPNPKYLKKIFEFRIKAKTGEWKIFHAKGNYLPDNPGIQGILVNSRDVTNIFETRKALETSKARHQQLIEQMPDAIYRSTPDGTLLMVNPALVKMLGYSQKEELLALDINSQLYYNQADRDQMLKSFDNSNTATYLLRLKKKDGSLIWVEEHGRKVLNEESGIAYYEGVLRDITFRKKSEDSLKNIAEGVSAETGEAFFDSLVKYLCKSLEIDCAFVSEKSGRNDNKVRVIAQRGMGEIFETGESYDLNGTPCKKVVVDNQFVCITSGLQPMFPDDTDLETLDAQSFIGTPLKNSQKKTIGHLAVLHKQPLNDDLSLYKNMVKIFAIRASAELERKHFEDKLVVQKATAENLNRLKTNFMANMSHEIRTPLNSILGFNTLLEEQLDDPDLSYFTSKINKSGERLLATINDLLDLAKIESNKTKLRMSHYNVGDQVESAVSLLSALAIKKNLRLIASIKKKNIFAELDANIFAQILNNTIGNAIKFTETGQVEVIVDTLNSIENDVISLQIRDSGVGIDEDFLSQVFDEFKQESEGLSRHYEGTGLGLTITKKIVELLKGTISINSIKGVGTTIEILIPRVFNPKTVDREEIIDNSMDVKKAESEKPKLLLVENNDENLNVILLTLKDHFTVDTAIDGITALGKVKKQNYAAILMDINLGRGMDGCEVKSELRSMHTYDNIPIIAITAYAMRGDRDKYLQQGFDDYIAKPFSKEDLVRIITEAISVKHAEE